MGTAKRIFRSRRSAIAAEGFGNPANIYFNEAGRAVAIEKHSFGWR